MKHGIEALTRRLNGGINKAYWSEKDVEALAEIYKVPLAEAKAVWRKTAKPSLKFGAAPITKDAMAATEIPARWKYTASDGLMDRDRDIISVAGIDLTAYRQNPIFFYQHTYDKPIGRSVEVEKRNGKLVGVLELGFGIYPDAEFVGKALAGGMLKGVSIGFDPVKWKYNTGRDGIDFHEVSLREISAVTIQSNYGSLIHGPVKSFKQQAEEYRTQAKADWAAVAKAKRAEEREAYMARTTPQQRKREREATLLRIRGQG